MTLFPLLRLVVPSFTLPHLPYAAFTAAEPTSAPALALTSGRLLGALATLVSLVCLLIGGRALRLRSKSSAVVAGWGGATGLGVAALVVARADQGLGSGQGLAGGVVGLVLGTSSVVLAAIAARRSSPQ